MLLQISECFWSLCLTMGSNPPHLLPKILNSLLYFYGFTMFASLYAWYNSRFTRLYLTLFSFSHRSYPQRIALQTSVNCQFHCPHLITVSSHEINILHKAEEHVWSCYNSAIPLRVRPPNHSFQSVSVQCWTANLSKTSPCTKVTNEIGIYDLNTWFWSI